MARKRQVTPGDPKSAIAYLRVSKEEQQLGPEAQRTAIELWAHPQGVTVASWHLDQLTSVTPIDKRPGLLAALLALRERGAGILVVAKRDRIARDPALTISIEQITRDAGAVLLSAAGEGNGDTPADEFMRGVIDSTARYERALIRARTKAALAVKRARGERTGTVPYGFRTDASGKLLVPDPYEQACIAEVLRLHATGLSQKKIARALWPRYKSRTGELFAQLQIHNMLKKAGMLTATVCEHVAQKSGATNGSAQGGEQGLPSVAPTGSLQVEVQNASPPEQKVEHPVTGQRLVNRRLVKKADYLRHGRPADLAWVIGQVKTLAGMGIPPTKIASALVRTGVRRGDGSDVKPEDVTRWAAT